MKETPGASLFPLPSGFASHRCNFNLVLAGFCILLTAGCGPGLFPIPDNPIQDPGLLLARAMERAERLASLSAEVRLRHRSKQGRIRGRVSILAAHGEARIRVDAWTPTDDLVAAFVADSDQFLYYERGADQCLTGKSCPSNISLLLPMGLGVTESAAAVLGIPPLDGMETAAGIDFDRRVGAYLVETVVGGGGTRRIWLRADGAAVQAEETVGRRVRWRMNFSDFREVDTRDSVPDRMRFESGSDGSILELAVRSAEVNPEIDPQDWLFECPQGMAVRQIRCQEEP